MRRISNNCNNITLYYTVMTDDTMMYIVALSHLSPQRCTPKKCRKEFRCIGIRTSLFARCRSR